MNASHPNETIDKDLGDILEPLIDLLIERYQNGEYQDPFAIIEITGGQMYRLESPHPKSVIIELPPRLQDFPPLTLTLATLLQRSGSDDGWFDREGSEDDPCRAPLRFASSRRLFGFPAKVASAKAYT